MEPSVKTRQTATIIFLVALSFILGVFLGNHTPREVDKVVGISHKTPEITTEADFSPFWRVWNTIDEKYPEAAATTGEDRINGAIAGLVASLDDPYSVFFTPEEAKSFEEEIAGNFSGVGMEVGVKDKVLTVIAPLKDTPAYRAGIKSGDKILKIDDTVTSGLSIEEAIKLMRGEKGTSVALTILREDSQEPIEIKIIRDIIIIPTLDTESKNGVFIIKLYSFSANSPNLFRNAIKKFTESGTDKLILDLRGNPGGYLEAAVDIASWFLPSGKVIVTEDYGINHEPEIFRSRGYDIFNNQLKFVILIDGGSASASEIVAGALQDHGRAKLVGEKSFGKGSVQEAIKITPDTLLKITVANWLTPNGSLITERGLTPDYQVEFTKKDLDEKKDPQMEKAMEILLASQKS